MSVGRGRSIAGIGGTYDNSLPVTHRTSIEGWDQTYFVRASPTFVTDISDIAADDNVEVLRLALVGEFDLQAEIRTAIDLHTLDVAPAAREQHATRLRPGQERQREPDDHKGND